VFGAPDDGDQQQRHEMAAAAFELFLRLRGE
jgi:hypothetical protein